MSEALQRRIYHLLESGRAHGTVPRLLDGAMCVLILLNVAAVAAETVPELAARYQHLFLAFEVFSVALFSIEYAARLWVCVRHPPLSHLPPLQARLRFAVTPYALIDLAAIAPFYLGVLLPVDLRLLRVLRLVRLLKLARYSPAIGTIKQVLYDERRALAGVLVIMGSLTVVSATFGWYAERAAQPEAFGNIPRAMWWALTTLTTVGYGDVVPVTPAGKLVGALVMLFGVGLFALPIAIISTGFAQELHRREFVVSWGMVSRIPLFSHLSPAEVIEVARHLSSQTLRAGSIIARPGDRADCLYLIVSGEVLVQPEGAHEPLLLAEGDWFGEVAMVARSRQRAWLSTVKDTRLMSLSAGDFHDMMYADPDFKRRIEESIHHRRAAPEAPDGADDDAS